MSPWQQLIQDRAAGTNPAARAAVPAIASPAEAIAAAALTVSRAGKLRLVPIAVIDFYQPMQRRTPL